MGNVFADPRTAQHIYPPVKSAEIIPTATCSHDPIEPQEGGQTSKIHDVNAKPAFHRATYLRRLNSALIQASPKRPAQAGESMRIELREIPSAS
jgi:hypothetical protein